MKISVKKAFTSSIPVMAGYIFLGIGFGILLASKGYGVLWALAMSIFMYAGAMQYVAVDLLASGAPLVTVAFTTFIVNARHLFYAIAMIDKYKNAGKAKPYLIHALTDETFSIVSTTKETDNSFFFFISLFDHLYWITGCVIGAAVGNAANINFEGIDFVLTALLISIFTEQWLQAKNHIPAIAGFGSALVCLLLVGSEYFPIPAMILIAVLLTVLRKRTEGDTNE